MTRPSTGPDAWTALLDQLGKAATALEAARVSVDTTRAELARARTELKRLHLDSEGLDPRLPGVEVARVLELDGSGDRLAGLERLQTAALEQLALVSTPLHQPHVWSAFTFARALVDTIGVELAELAESYEVELEHPPGPDPRD